MDVSVYSPYSYLDPYRLDEYYIAGEADAKPVFSTVYQSILPSIKDPSVFDVKSLLRFVYGMSYSVDSGKCTRNNKGWPYQQIFGPFVRALSVCSYLL